MAENRTEGDELVNSIREQLQVTTDDESISSSSSDEEEEEKEEKGKENQFPSSKLTRPRLTVISSLEAAKNVCRSPRSSFACFLLFFHAHLTKTDDWYTWFRCCRRK